MNDDWVRIKGCEKTHMINKNGDVKSLDRYIEHLTSPTGKAWRKGRVLKSHPDKDGYLKVSLFINGKIKRFFVHRLLAIHFIPNPENKLQVNHINGIKDDNRLENLEWVTASENIQHSIRELNRPSLKGEKHNMVKLTKEHVKNIRLLYAFDGLTQKQLGKYYGVTQSMIGNIVNRKRWAHI